MTYNEIVKSAMAEENNLYPVIADKLAVKDFAAELGVKTPKNISMNKPTRVVKANNDCGSTVIYKDNKIIRGDPSKLYKYKNKAYGVNKGEWWYGLIEHTIFAEEYLSDNITDYKFHCQKGKVIFCQVIGDRSIGTKECLYLPDGTLLDYILDLNFAHGYFELPATWEKMKQSAEKLSSKFSYLRVDLYEHNNEVYLGELTVAPRAGNYKGEGQVKLGEYFNQ